MILLTHLQRQLFNLTTTSQDILQYLTTTSQETTRLDDYKSRFLTD